MSDPVRIALVGATGLVGRSIVEESVGRADIRLLGIARREAKLPRGACMEMVIADPAEWGAVLERTKPTVLISALGTTIRKVGGDRDAFAAVDKDLVLATARGAHRAGVERMIAVSSIGADATSRNFYLKAKGETERELLKIGFGRVDILRPGLLLGERQDDLRFAEKLGVLASPLASLFLHGKYRQYRSIHAGKLAQAALVLSTRKAAGKFVHDHDAISRAANSLPKLHPEE